MKRAIFLDRDGVINRKGGPYYIYLKEDFVLNEGVTEALKYFMHKGFLLIIITNQGGIAKGVYTEEQMHEVHNFMKELLKKDGIEIAGIYYCPHHPDVSPCECRKPGTLLLEKAIKDFNIDTASSWMIGDSEIDIQAAEKMGIKGVLIPENGNMMELIVKPGLIT
ncbi:MAG TPA: HAD family hydrolase [Bacteroidales bacterium]|nr:HAD family hydrolase [Bacteroidales bacterium]HOK75498.1 HAD family hydrolase [Bacteroidales bacterium]HOM40133.1 HAD family hydrolase [Bacteroidales bacterium]HOU31568.1 HAD family hydrolase [Bacteroidales bacterium]HPP93241.1 HAD family hydrolase [Bacteroidales bacterium]